MRRDAATKAAIDSLPQIRFQEQYPRNQYEEAYRSETGVLEYGQPLSHDRESGIEIPSPELELSAWPAAPMGTRHTVVARHSML